MLKLIYCFGALVAATKLKVDSQSSASVQQDLGNVTIYIDFGYPDGPKYPRFNQTFNVPGLRPDGTFTPGINATYDRGDGELRGCPIERGSLQAGFIEFRCKRDLYVFRCDASGNCSA